MKTATIPSLRVDPELRHAAESVLQEWETLSSFVEQSLRIGIDHRRAQRTGEYFAADEVLQELDEMIAKAQAKPGK